MQMDGTAYLMIWGAFSEKVRFQILIPNGNKSAMEYT